MNDDELLEALQGSGIVVSLHFETSGERDKSIPAGLRRDLNDALDKVREAFAMYSLPFGERRLILASQFETVVRLAGAGRQQIKALSAQITEEQADGFRCTFVYEPIPNASGFALLPPQFQAALIGACNRKQVTNYYDGLDRLGRETWSAANHFVQRLTDYDKWMTAGGVGKSVVLRDVVRGRFFDHLQTLLTYNIVQSERYLQVKRFADACGLLDITTVQLRSDGEKRAAALDASSRITTYLRATLFGADDADEDGSGEGEDGSAADE